MYVALIKGCTRWKCNPVGDSRQPQGNAFHVPQYNPRPRNWLNAASFKGSFLLARLLNGTRMSVTYVLPRVSAVVRAFVLSCTYPMQDMRVIQGSSSPCTWLSVGTVPNDQLRPVCSPRLKRFFLMLVEYFCRFGPKYFDLTSLLIDLTKTRRLGPVQWSEQCQETFVMFKVTLLHLGLLASLPWFLFHFSMHWTEDWRGEHCPRRSRNKTLHRRVHSRWWLSKSLRQEGEPKGWWLM